MSASARPRTSALPLVRGVSIAWILGIVAAALVFFETSLYGVGITRDSTEYLYAAHTFLQGRGFLYLEGGQMTAWPPLYPILLAAGTWPFGHMTDVARILSALCCGVLVLMGGWWLERHCRSRPVAVIGSVAILLCVPLWDIEIKAASEPPFLVFITGSLLLLGAACARPSTRLIVLAAGLAALAWFTRYTGLTVAIAGVVALIAWPAEPFLVRLRNAALFGSIAALPNVLWLVRNENVSGTLMGPREPSPYSVGHILEPLPRTLAEWFVPPNLPYAAVIATGALFLLVACALGLLAPHRGESVIREALPYIFPMAVFIPIYLVWLVCAQIETFLTPIDMRYLSPIAVPVMLILALMLDRLVFLYSWQKTALLVLASLWLLYPLAHLQQRTDVYRSFGIYPYSSAITRESPTLALVRRYSLPGPVYASDPFAVYAVSGKAVAESPYRIRAQWPNDPFAATTLRSVLRRTRRALLIWTPCCAIPNGLSPPALRHLLRVRALARTRDGGIYALSLRRRLP